MLVSFVAGTYVHKQMPNAASATCSGKRDSVTVTDKHGLHCQKAGLQGLRQWLGLETHTEVEETQADKADSVIYVSSALKVTGAKKHRSAACADGSLNPGPPKYEPVLPANNASPIRMINSRVKCVLASHSQSPIDCCLGSASIHCPCYDSNITLSEAAPTRRPRGVCSA